MLQELRGKCRIIDISAVFEKWEHIADLAAWERATPTEVVFSWYEVIEALCEGQVNLPALQEFLRYAL